MNIGEFNDRARQLIGRDAAYPDWTGAEAAQVAGLLLEHLEEGDDALLRCYLLMIACEHQLALPEALLWREVEAGNCDLQCRSEVAGLLVRTVGRSPEAVERLQRLIGDGDNPVREILIGLAGNWRAAECVDTLAGLASSGDEMAVPAINALRRIGDERARAVFEARTGDADGAVREAARRGLEARKSAEPTAPPPGVERLDREALRRLRRESGYRAVKHNLNQAHHLAATGQVDLETLGRHYELNRQRLRRFGFIGAVKEFFASPLPDTICWLRMDDAMALLRDLPELSGGRFPAAAGEFLARRVAGLPSGVPEAWRVELGPGEFGSVRIGVDKRLCDHEGQLGLKYKFASGCAELFLALACDPWDEVEVRWWCRDKTLLAVCDAAYYRLNDREESAGTEADA